MRERKKCVTISDYGSMKGRRRDKKLLSTIQPTKQQSSSTAAASKQQASNNYCKRNSFEIVYIGIK